MIRVDTFAKLLGPGYRVGWVTAHPAFIHKLALAVTGSTVGPCGIVEVGGGGRREQLLWELEGGPSLCPGLRAPSSSSPPPISPPAWPVSHLPAVPPGLVRIHALSPRLQVPGSHELPTVPRLQVPMSCPPFPPVPPIPPQVLIHALLQQWGREGFATHVLHLQALYGRLAREADAAAHLHLADLCDWQPSKAGMFMWFKMKGRWLVRSWALPGMHYRGGCLSSCTSGYEYVHVGGWVGWGWCSVCV